jgi:hypothetical protein
MISDTPSPTLPCVTDIAEKIADANLNKCRQYITINCGSRFQRSFIDSIIEAEHRTVEIFKRVLRVIGSSATGQNGRHCDRADQAPDMIHFLVSSFPSAALLNRN